MTIPKRVVQMDMGGLLNKVMAKNILLELKSYVLLSVMKYLKRSMKSQEKSAKKDKKWLLKKEN